MGQDMIRSRSGYFRPNIKIVLSIGILWRGHRALTLERQVPVRSRAGHLGSLKEVTFVPCPKPLGCYRHSQWQLKSHRRRENRRLLDLVDDAVLLRKHCLCFTGSLRSLWNSVWNSLSLHFVTNTFFILILSFFFFLFFQFLHKLLPK
jgi:hypothetical protein